jgi:hypothetical protein
MLYRLHPIRLSFLQESGMMAISRSARGTIARIAGGVSWNFSTSDSEHDWAGKMFKEVLQTAYFVGVHPSASQATVYRKAEFASSGHKASIMG